MSITLKREQRTIRYYTEVLRVKSAKSNAGITLDMILIPGGTFLMGSPEQEFDRWDDESPQHQVTVPTFFMAKFPVTQQQWATVTALPKIERALERNPSSFKGNNRPVENISWHEATEFCRRLADKTGRTYRLPTEAEWEYACRAGTTTPFHIGETITTDLANYRGTDDGEWSGSYGQGPKGVYRKETTPVDRFPPNAFGLHDMHGNIWEWCQDHWHNNYRNAPIDGSAWIDEEAAEDAKRVLRGGSWVFDPRYCRSATRYDNDAGFRLSAYGFRVVCSAPRTR